MQTHTFEQILSGEPLPDPRQVAMPSMPELLPDLIKSANMTIREIKTALDQDPLLEDMNLRTLVRQRLHCFKGEAGIMGMMDIHQLCIQSEAALEELSNEQIKPALIRFSNWVTNALQHLRKNSDHYHQNAQMHTHSPTLNILIVDDDYACAAALQHILSPLGKSTLASCGKKAIDFVNDSLVMKEPFDLICLDINLKDFNGLATLKTIRDAEKQANLPAKQAARVIMTTVQGDSAHVFGSFRSGCEAYILKPVNRSKLLSELKKLGLLPSEDQTDNT